MYRELLVGHRSQLTDQAVPGSERAAPAMRGGSLLPASFTAVERKGMTAVFDDGRIAFDGGSRSSPISLFAFGLDDQRARSGMNLVLDSSSVINHGTALVQHVSFFDDIISGNDNLIEGIAKLACSASLPDRGSGRGEEVNRAAGGRDAAASAISRSLPARNEERNRIPPAIGTPPHRAHFRKLVGSGKAPNMQTGRAARLWAGPAERCLHGATPDCFLGRYSAVPPRRRRRAGTHEPRYLVQNGARDIKALPVAPAKAGIVRLQAQLVREVEVLPRYAYSGL